jgi:plasmid stabilization system protein ParE
LLRRAAYAWYEERNPGLDEEFYKSLSVALTCLEQNPETPPTVYKDFGRVLLRRFPYAVFYRNDLEVIHVFSVFHCSQNPEKWLERIKGKDGPKT